MLVTMPARRRVAIAQPAVSLARRFVLIALAADGADAVRVLVRDAEFVGNLDAAVRHAELLADGLSQFHAMPVEAQVLDAATGFLMFSTAGGAL